LSPSCSAWSKSLVPLIDIIESERLYHWERKLTRKQTRESWIQGCALVSAQFTIIYSSFYLIAFTCHLSLQKLHIQLFDLLVFESWYKIHFNNLFKAFITTRFFIRRSVKYMCKTKRIHWQQVTRRLLLMQHLVRWDPFLRLTIPTTTPCLFRTQKFMFLIEVVFLRARKSGCDLSFQGPPPCVRAFLNPLRLKLFVTIRV